MRSNLYDPNANVVNDEGVTVPTVIVRGVIVAVTPEVTWSTKLSYNES